MMEQYFKNNISEAFENVLEYLDNNPHRNAVSGSDLSEIGTGIDSYFLEKAVSEGYLIEKPKSCYNITTMGLDLLNQMRLRGAIESFDKFSKTSSYIIIGLTIVMLILTGVIAWLTWILSIKG